MALARNSFAVRLIAEGSNVSSLISPAACCSSLGANEKMVATRNGCGSPCCNIRSVS